MTMKRVIVAVAYLSCVAAYGVGATDRDLYDEASRRLRAGNYDVAIERFQTLLDEYPASPYRASAQVGIGRSLYYRGDYDAARELLDRAAVRARDGEQLRTIRLWIGLTAFRQGDYTAVDVALSDYIAENPAPVARAWLYRGVARSELGRVGEAVGDLTTAFDRTSDAERSYAAAVLMGIHASREEYRLILDRIAQLEEVMLQPGRPYSELMVRYAADAAFAVDDIAAAERYYRDLTAHSAAAAQWGYRRLFALARDAGDREAMQGVYREAERRLAGEPRRLIEFWVELGSDALDRERYELAELYLSRAWEVRAEQVIDGRVPLLFAAAVERRQRPEEAFTLLFDSLTDAGVTDNARDERVVEAARLAVRAEDYATAVGLLEEYALVTASAESLYLWAFAQNALGEEGTVRDRLGSAAAQPLIRGYPPLTRLRARLLLSAGEAVEAVRSYRSYLAERPEDETARRELVRALVAAGQFGAVSQEIARLSTRDDEVAYLEGIAAFAREDYATAVTVLGAVGGDDYEPLRSYHLAWSLYRTGEVAAAGETIAAVVDALPPSLGSRGRYLYAWTLYQAGGYAAAADQLLLIVAAGGGAIYEPAQRLLATVYRADRRYDDALRRYQRLAEEAATADAEAEYAMLIADTLIAAGRREEAIARYDETARRFDALPAGRQAVVRAGELLYEAGEFQAARDRFRRYQALYPEGEQLDRALYWAGMTSLSLGEESRALLWWEPLITRFPQSDYTPEVLYRTGEIYINRNQRREALELYDRLTVAYPDTQWAGQAEPVRRTIRLELDGLSGREAELWVALEPPAGAAPGRGSEEWFSLVLELGRIAIREQITLTRERSRIVDYLIQGAALDGEAAARASLLLAEYYRDRGERNAAVERYIEAAGTDGAPDELRAQSLFELAVTAREGGDTRTADDAMDELIRRFPGTIWADRVQRMMESN